MATTGETTEHFIAPTRKASYAMDRQQKWRFLHFNGAATPTAISLWLSHRRRHRKAHASAGVFGEPFLLHRLDAWEASTSARKARMDQAAREHRAAAQGIAILTGWEPEVAVRGGHACVGFQRSHIWERARSRTDAALPS